MRARFSHQQKTIARSVKFNGVGVHSGSLVHVRLMPAEDGTGIVFRRMDVSVNQDILARWDFVKSTQFCVEIANQHGVSISTIEHLMAALAALEIDNVIVEVNGPEMPILDGSSAPLLALLHTAGIAQQAAPRTYIKVLRPVSVVHGEDQARLVPANTFSVRCTYDFQKREGFAPQTALYDHAHHSFENDVANARTFGFLDQVEMLRSRGLSKGGSLENAVVFDGTDVLNPEGLRMADECSRHKVLDAIGDLYLAGHQIIGHFEGIRSGHTLDVEILRALFAQAGSYCLLSDTPVASQPRSKCIGA